MYTITHHIRITQFMWEEYATEFISYVHDFSNPSGIGWKIFQVLVSVLAVVMNLVRSAKAIWKKTFTQMQLSNWEVRDCLDRGRNRRVRYPGFHSNIETLTTYPFQHACCRIFENLKSLFKASSFLYGRPSNWVHGFSSLAYLSSVLGLKNTPPAWKPHISN